MPEGGTLTLRSRAAQSDRVCVEVSDTGLGMDETTRTRCLEPFFTTKGERGTGLGLAMVYGVMQRHSGDIDTLSETTTRSSRPTADSRASMPLPQRSQAERHSMSC